LLVAISSGVSGGEVVRGAVYVMYVRANISSHPRPAGRGNKRHWVITGSGREEPSAGRYYLVQPASGCSAVLPWHHLYISYALDMHPPCTHYALNTHPLCTH
jgi:hypothetical protein